jgi:cation diffusion facilitator family transporter
MNAVGRPYQMPEDKQRTLRKAVRLEWIFLGLLISIIGVMAVVMGSSQTMKTMWIEDTLSVIPSCSFLIGARLRNKTPNEAYPYGYRRAVLVGFLSGALALFGLGVYLLGDSLVKLVTAEHPTVQTVTVFGRRVWLGWLMLGALIYSVIPPWILGRMKAKLAEDLHDKALHVSAQLNKGDWLSGIAGVIGILGIGFGLWWADSCAAAFISFEILRDGWANLRNSVAQLMNKRPSDIDTKSEDPVIDRLQKAIGALEWVEKARVRLREDGDVLTGEVFLQPRDEHGLLDRLQQARDVANSVDWRLHDISLVPVRTVD